VLVVAISPSSKVAVDLASFVHRQSRHERLSWPETARRAAASALRRMKVVQRRKGCNPPAMRNIMAWFLGALLLTACGGGGGYGGGGPPPPTGWQMGVFQPSASYEAMCVVPRTGIDPGTSMAYPDKAGTLLDENNWLRSWTNELYLWYSEVQDQNPSLFTTTDSYFQVLKTTAITASGAHKDKFHFTYTTSQWESLSLNGVQAGYGAQWVLVAAAPPRQIIVAFTEPGSPAITQGNLLRGAEVLAVDGVDAVNDNTQAGVDTLNAGLFPAGVNEMHTFQIQDPGGGQRTVMMTSANITSHPVQNVGTIPVTGGSVGYMLFNDHLATSEPALVTAFTTLQNAAVIDLVLDIRYNGGGYLDIASEVAYMIAGPGPTTGQTFELTQFNSKYPTTDPVTHMAIVPVPFHSTTQGFTASPAAGIALPTLNLLRVFVLTGPDTCSASESIINSLRGVNVQVIQIGSTTCGKPYGFYPQDNCGITYFSIEFRGVNAANFGDYTDGFSPLNAPAPAGVGLPGCSIGDDFTHALGDPAEARLATALNYRNLGAASCPAASGLGKVLRARQISAVNARLPDSPLRNLRLLRR
jgi:carboxyl-terminal processing protease